MAAFLTKANFMSGLQCHKQLWLQVQEPHRATALTPVQQRIIDQGEDVGQYARQQFPDGQLIESNGTEAVQATQKALAQALPGQFAAGVTCLFEAAFSFAGLFIRCNIFQKVSASTWELIEVKSSGKIKEEHSWDLAVQKYVLTGVGLAISATKLMHINTQTCCFPDLTNLFTIADLTAAVDRLLPEIPQKLEQFGAILTEPSAPTLVIGRHCNQPNACPFTQDCWQHVPEVSIFTIPRLDWKKKDTLLAQGVLSIADLPPNCTLSDKHRTYVDSVLSNQPVIDRAAIAASLAELNYPIHCFDFETQNPAIPRFNGLSPYEQFPFQYSCHVLHEDGHVEHREYLHTDPSDPKLPLIATLTNDIAANGSVIVYHQSFEGGLLRKLALTERFPGVTAIIVDGTGPVQRPKDSQRQKEHYAGKKKRHTRKHITGSTRQKRVIILTKARAGTIHDKRQLDEEAVVSHIPETVAVEGDLGFQGLQNEFENIQLPHKKPKGKELSDQQKQENRACSRQRVVCEHAHAGIKRYNAVTVVYRNRVPDFDDRLMLNAACLWISV